MSTKYLTILYKQSGIELHLEVKTWVQGTTIKKLLVLPMELLKPKTMKMSLLSFFIHLLLVFAFFLKLNTICLKNLVIDYVF